MTHRAEHWHWEFLAQLGKQLVATLDPDDAARKLARCLVPGVAVCCIVDLIDDDGGRRRVVAIAGESEDARRLERDLEGYVPMDASNPVAIVLRDRKPLLLESWEEESRRSLAQDERQMALLGALPADSVVLVPIVARDRDVGVLTLFCDGAHHLSDEQLAFAEEVASRAAFTIDNARLYRKLEEANAAKDEFLSLVSHELRTPLTTILGNAMLLQERRDRLDGKMRREALNDIASESLRLENIIDNLLFLARTEQGQLPPRQTQFVIHAVEKVVARHQRANPARRIDTVQVSGLRPVAFPAGYLDQVVENLLSNAEKYSPADSPITVEVRRGEHEVSVTVADGGPGIPEDQIEHLFEPYYRAPRARQRAPGLGIGLAVCKRLVEAQGGAVWARSRDGGGAEFGFTLPVSE